MTKNITTKTKTRKTLKFGFGNAKLSTAIATFSLPAGHTCPFAKECLSKADKVTGKIIDGQHCKFRCFAASQECAYPNVRKQRWGNFEALKGLTVEKMVELIQATLPKGYAYVHVHVSGDFFNEKYFIAWLNIAMNNPLTTFYGYTKCLPFLVKYAKVIPRNFRFTASRGGKCDELIAKHKLRSAEVVFSVKEAAAKGLEIDHDDTHAITGEKPFALLIHGTQPAGTEASKAWQTVKTTVGGYGKGSQRYDMAGKKKAVIFLSVKSGKVTFPNAARKVPLP